MTAHKVLPRQKTIYTCGAACLSAIAHILGYDATLYSEKKIADECGAIPVYGIDNDVMHEYALKNFGEHYLGLADGIEIPSGAIWNIQNPISGVGHYVVVISHNSRSVRFYCPYYANTLELPWNKIIWESSDKVYVRWALKFNLNIPENAIFLGDEWPEMGLSYGEPNPHWLLRSMNRFLTYSCCKEK